MTAAVASRAGEIDLFTLEARGECVGEATEAFALLLGKPVGEISGRSLLELVHPDDRQELDEGLDDLDRDKATTFECRFSQSNGQAVYVEWVARPLESGGRWQAAGTDTADLAKLLADRRDLRTRLDLAVGQAVAVMWDLELASGAYNWEPRAAEILGVAAEDLPMTAAALVDAVHPHDREDLAAALGRMVEEGTAEVGVRVGPDDGLRHLSLRGRVLDRGRGRTPERAVGLLLDITVEKALEEQLLRMSVSDGLTGTRNRRGFDQTLRGEWRRCKRAGEPLSLLMIDIDRFKAFNDAHGHLVGDQALVAVSRALAGAMLRGGDTLARYGGEEFAVVLPNVPAAGAEQVAGRMLQAVRGIELRQAPDWRPSVSIGASTWLPAQGTVKPSELLGLADRALYVAKRGGRDRFVAH